ncbi:hypothetical protein Tsubulata_035158 [Turnera subulata]|uniref:HMA domain-containing protein n=1 Tax=Turnera subulata TaxID=218843 RepID=A0A9Q0J274_9ROSI|nr:hypothetical protein Tsubulata_035158 [Turnera subulata]
MENPSGNSTAWEEEEQWLERILEIPYESESQEILGQPSQNDHLLSRTAPPAHMVMSSKVDSGLHGNSHKQLALVEYSSIATDSIAGKADGKIQNQPAEAGAAEYYVVAKGYVAGQKEDERQQISGRDSQNHLLSRTAPPAHDMVISSQGGSEVEAQRIWNQASHNQDFPSKAAPPAAHFGVSSKVDSGLFSACIFSKMVGFPVCHTKKNGKSIQALTEPGTAQFLGISDSNGLESQGLTVATVDRRERKIKIDKDYRERQKEQRKNLEVQNAELHERLRSAYSQIQQLQFHIDHKDISQQLAIKDKAKEDLQACLRANAQLQKELESANSTIEKLKGQIQNRQTDHSRKFNIVLEMPDLHDDKGKQKAIEAVAGLPGLDSVEVSMRNRTLTVTGDVDPVVVASNLKHFKPKILKVWPIEHKKEEKKEEVKKSEGNSIGDLLRAYHHVSHYPIQQRAHHDYDFYNSGACEAMPPPEMFNSTQGLLFETMLSPRNPFFLFFLLSAFIFLLCKLSVGVSIGQTMMRWSDTLWS